MPTRQVRKEITILLSLLIFNCILAASTTNIDYEVRNLTSNLENFKNELSFTLKSGQPMVPYLPIKILLPMGEKFSSIEIEYGGSKEELDNIALEIAKPMLPISSEKTPAYKPPNKFESDIYPEKEYEILGVQRKNGFDILLINLYVYRYNLSQRSLSWFSEVDFKVVSQKDNKLINIQNQFLQLSKKAEIESLVINPELISSYKKEQFRYNRNLPDPDTPFEMIIITDSESAEYFEEYISWKQSHNIQTGLFLISEIENSYDGVDNAEKLRNFIIDAYVTYSDTDTPLEYVLLGGDDEIIPIRGCFGQVGNTIDNSIPCDLYFSCLDGNWDENENGIYGEYAEIEEADLLPEISLGRLPMETETEFNNFFEKTYDYVESLSYSHEIAYMIGENLNWNPVTWGGDYKDEIKTRIEPNSEMKVFSLYQREGNFNAINVKDAINSGLSIINHMGHSNETMVFGQTSSLVNSYTNTDYGFAYSQGCYPAAFDQMTSGQSECIAEHFVKSEKGLFAFIGNTRYGWYMPGSTDGASQFYDRAFFDALYLEDIKELGKALDYSRVELVNEALSEGVMRWCYYEMVLFGDPSIAIKETEGIFPYLEPANITYDDIEGDNDGSINPDEVVNLDIGVKNLPDWQDAESVYAKIYFSDSTVEILQDSVFYGDISSGETAYSEPFKFEIPAESGYESIEYTLKIVADVGANNIFEKEYVLSFDISFYQTSWPWQPDNNVLANPILVDFNQDGLKDILVMESDAKINLLDHNAQQIQGFPWLNNENVIKSAAIGDLNNDSYPDLVYCGHDGMIEAISNNGNTLFQYDSETQQNLTPVIADINGDNSKEVITLGMDKNLYVFNNQGQILPDFPIELSHTSMAEIASADLDENGKNEIIISTLDGYLHVFNDEGLDLNGFPINFNSSLTTPIILDNLNIVVSAGEIVYTISPEGEIIHQKDIGNSIAGSVICADFDNDESLEIAFNTQNGFLYLMEQNGDILDGFPQDLGSYAINPPLAVDMNADDNVDIISFTAFNKMYAFNNDGSEMVFSPIDINISGNLPASIDDIDEDGDYDIFSGSSVNIYAIDIKTAKGLKMPWRTYRGNYARTGYYGDNELSSAPNQVVGNEFALNLRNYPNPFNPSTKICFELADKTIRTKKISIFNLKGQKIRTLFSESNIQSRSHSTVWDGKDENMKSVASGLYFYQIKIKNQEKTGRCLLLK